MKQISFLMVIALAVVLFGCARDTTKLDTPPPETARKAAVNEIAPNDALQKTQAAYSQFVDVRTPEEYAKGHAARAINIPLNELPEKLDRLEKNEPVYVICQTGRRSKEASEILVKNGYNWVFNVSGGTAAWESAGLPIEKPAAK